MAYRINPAFDRFPNEARLVGLILASFGELELTVCHNADIAVSLPAHAVLKALYKLRATSSRIDLAETLMEPIYEQHAIDGVLHVAVLMVRHCLKIRNQYAHCNWADAQGNPEAGIFFADVQTSAENKNFEHFYKHVDPALLQQQLDYFGEALEALRYADSRLMIAQGKKGFSPWPEPITSLPPPLHNLASLHAPPWLNGDALARHLKRAQGLEQSAQKPERQPSIVRLTREEWAAKDAKDAREKGKDAEGR